MLKPPNRLKARGDFKRTLTGKRLCINDCFVLYGLPAHTPGSAQAPVEPRFGFIVSKKIHKKSVHRNRIRRRLRELIRTWLLAEQRERVSRYRTLVFIARGGSLTASYQDLKERLEKCAQYL